MTTIAAKKNPTNGTVTIAWDSQVTGGTVSVNTNKVVKVNDQFAVGISGHLRFANIVHRASVDMIHPFDLAQPTFDAYGWLIDELVPSWGHALKRAISSVPEDEELTKPSGVALVVIAGGIYEIGFDFSVCNVGNFGSIGSGCYYASTAMHLGKSAKQAVTIASELDLYTGGEIKEAKV